MLSWLRPDADVSVLYKMALFFKTSFEKIKLFKVKPHKLIL